MEGKAYREKGGIGAPDAFWHRRVPFCNFQFGSCGCQIGGSRLLGKRDGAFQTGPLFVKNPHVPQIPGGKAAQTRQFVLQPFADGVDGALAPKALPGIEGDVFPMP